MRYKYLSKTGTKKKTCQPEYEQEKHDKPPKYYASHSSNYFWQKKKEEAQEGKAS